MEILKIKLDLNYFQSLRNGIENKPYSIFSKVQYNVHSQGVIVAVTQMYVSNHPTLSSEDRYRLKFKRL